MTRKRMQAEIERLTYELSAMRDCAILWKVNYESAMSAVDNLTSRLNAMELGEKQRGTAIVERFKNRLAKEPEVSIEMYCLVCEILEEITEVER
jgi:hypothetical protein